MTPWEHLDNLVSMDRGPEHDEAWMEKRMKEKWPGNYRIEIYTTQTYTHDRYIRYCIAFNDPKEEMMFRLKYSHA